jgi:hypothetical protein
MERGGGIGLSSRRAVMAVRAVREMEVGNKAKRRRSGYQEKSVAFFDIP